MPLGQRIRPPSGADGVEPEAAMAPGITVIVGKVVLTGVPFKVAVMLVAVPEVTAENVAV